MADTTEKLKRHIRTPAEIAQAELEQATQRVERAEKRVTAAREELAKAESEVTAAKRRADYAAQHPDLPENAHRERRAAEPENEEREAAQL